MDTPFSWSTANEKNAAYQEALALAFTDYKALWRREAGRLSWTKPFDEVHNDKFAEARWFSSGTLNASLNCLDRHIQQNRGHHVAIESESEEGLVRQLSFSDLYKLTCNIATILHANGIRQGDRVALYMPMTPEAIASMLACARIGAIHTVIFGGFSESAIVDRIEDAKAKAVITAEQTTRKGQTLNLRNTVMEAVADPRSVSISFVLSFGLEKSDNDKLIAYKPSSSWPEEVSDPKSFDAEHPLFILYTSGTTGKPKGLYHTTGGYLTQVVSTTKWVFDLNDNDLYWCTADIGWITGHSYVVYGPLSLGKAIFIYDGALNWPTPSRIYKLIADHKISILYTAPTAIRMFMQAGAQRSEDYSLSSLRLLGSVGEPINPEAWRWYREVFGKNRAFVIDSWWQTETGSMMITPIEGISTMKPGSASKPFLGVSAKIVDDNGVTSASNSGYLVIDKPWPSMARGIWGDEERFHQIYFSKFRGLYFTGDGAKIDVDGDFFISGRIDDVVNVAGHRLGTAEVESALVSHEAVAEAAVVGIPDEITGQKLVAFILLIQGYSPSDSLALELKNHVKLAIGSFAKPADIHFERVLPKTRSGKIMRRYLRAKANGEVLKSDLSTLDEQTLG